MTITALPPAPSRADAPDVFIAKANVFVAALTTLVTEMNAALGVVNITEWVSGTTYAIGDVTWSPIDFQAYRRKTAGAGTTDPSADSTNWQRTEYNASSAQAQTGQAYTTAGTSTAFTLTPSPAIAGLVTGQEWDVTFNAAAGATPTLAVSGLTAKLLKYRDSAGAKQAVTSTQVPSGWRSKVVYDGTDYIVREVPPAAAVTPYTLTLAAMQASTSGTAINFTGIPAGAKRITIMLDGVSTNTSTTQLILRIGDSGGLETSGYSGCSVTAAPTDGFALTDFGSAGDVHTGMVILHLMDVATNKWCAGGAIAIPNSPNSQAMGGVKSLTATLDRLSITTSAGTATFDAGNVNISYEV